MLKYTICIPILVSSFAHAEMVFDFVSREYRLHTYAIDDSSVQSDVSFSHSGVYSGVANDYVGSSPLNHSSASISYFATGSPTGFVSRSEMNTSVSAADTDGAISGATVYARNSYTFTIDQDTTFRMRGTLDAVGHRGISRVGFLGSFYQLSYAVRNQHLEIDQLVMLAPGQYSFVTYTSVENLLAEQGESFTSYAAQDVEVFIVPAPAPSAIIASGLLLAARRRRGEPNPRNTSGA